MGFNSKKLEKEGNITSLNVKTRVIMFANQKGGVGKTTSAVNIATVLAAMNYKVLVIDFDSQGNASSSFNAESTKFIHDWMLGACEAGEVIVNYFENLDLIPSGRDLAGFEIEMAGDPSNYYKLKEKISALLGLYDYIFIDCPPSLGFLTINALVASNYVLIPTQCEYFSMEGIAHIVKTIGSVKVKLNPEIEILGFLLTMFDKRSLLNLNVAREIRGYFGGLVFENVIPRNVKIAEAPSHGKPIILYDVKSAGAKAYMDVTREIIERVNQKTVKEVA